MWHKSSYSNDAAHCVEVSEGPSTLVRDTRNRTAAILAFPASEWIALVAGESREPVSR
ncbi:protein of unknown function [Nocardiopsis flavescens]|uniref:DUF397 domain-containing protein n=1 Tax=Nocardiopsis flavescens TaxID=758803 RepID=A0A1M6MJ63_9ACTN|nr:protein of unknown function [Nocardiopsis flavescens]